jgi:hypothetical protein
MRRWVIQPCWHVAGWLSGYTVARIVLGGTSAEDQYALISAWWASLYVGYIVEVPPTAFVPLVLAYFAFGLAVVAVQPDVLFSGPAEPGLLRLVALVGQSLVFASPPLFNVVSRRLVQRFPSQWRS